MIPTPSAERGLSPFGSLLVERVKDLVQGSAGPLPQEGRKEQGQKGSRGSVSSSGAGGAARARPAEACSRGPLHRPSSPPM